MASRKYDCSRQLEARCALDVQDWYRGACVPAGGDDSPLVKLGAAFERVATQREIHCSIGRTSGLFRCEMKRM